MRLIDLVGKRFGQLVVVAKSDKNKHSQSRWLCQCDCGVVALVFGADLRMEHTRSCGCLRCQPKMTARQLCVNRKYKDYRQGARARGLEWALTKDELKDLIFGDCECCGVGPSAVLKLQRSDFTEVVWNGIDRIDNKQGYVVGNVRTYCGDCNMARKDKSDQDWQAWLERVVYYRTAAAKESLKYGT